MNEFIADSEWFNEDNFDKLNKINSEKYFSLGNGKIIQQGNFEEYFSGNTLMGSYCKPADKNIFNNSKAFYESFDQNKEMTVNAPDWTPVVVRLNDEILDLNTWKILKYQQVLNLKEAFAERIVEVESPRGFQISIRSKRFISFAQPDTAVIYYNVRSLNFEGRISLTPLLNGDISNDKTQLNLLKWNVLQTVTQKDVARIWTQIKLHDFHVCSAMTYSFYKNNEEIKTIAAKIEKEKAVGFSVGSDVHAGERLTLYKYVSIISSDNFPHENLTESGCEKALKARQKGWNTLFEEHIKAWEKIYLKEAKPDNTVIDKEQLIKIFNRFRTY